MSRKSKEERLAEQKAMLEKVAHAADTTERRKHSRRPSVFGKNIISDAQMKLEEANAQIAELKSQIEQLKTQNTSPELIQALEDQVKNLQSKATLELNPNEIIVTRFANRDEIFFQTAEFYELVESIRANGQAIPITVRPSESGDGYELISGRRRLEACRLLGINVIAILVNADDKKLTELQVLENFRDDLSHFEEADNFEMMIREGFFKTNAELAKTFGMSEGKISQLRSISKIPKWLRKEFLMKMHFVTRPLPSGEEKEVLELDIAPSRLCYELSRHISDDFETKHAEKIKASAKSILDLKDFKSRVKRIIEIINEKALPSKKPDQVKNKIRVGDKIVAETIKSGGSWQVKVPKKYNSEELTSALEKAVTEVINQHFSSKD
jgi:ParB/RepB/Spo0J family partition protein